MNKELFSLKNIYRLLTDNEYPKLSYPVISKNNLKGLTLVRFWSSVMLQDFRGGRYGKMIFRTEGSRNRFFSQVCNRDEAIKFYPEYAQELDNIMDTDILKRQTEMMASFLTANEFIFDVLVTKVRSYLKILADTDAAATAAVMEFFDKMLSDGSSLENADCERKAKYAGYLLTCLQVIGLYGTQMEEKGRDSRVADIFGKTYIILMRVGLIGIKGERELKIISNRSSTLWTQSAQPDKFYGRETEMFDLNEAAETGGRYLISGHGGIGKTELMRRLMFEIIEKLKADAVAAISYKGNIADSLTDAFKWMSIVPDADLAGSKILIKADAEPMDYANEIIAYLRSFDRKKLVIFIDDVDKSFVDDPLFETICDLPAVIFATSRMSRVPHFTQYKVDEPTLRDGMLIFRGIYGKRLNTAEKQRLMDFLSESKWCHTQTLLLLAKLAKKNGWNLDTLIAKAESMSIKSLQDAYQGMYSLAGLSPEEKNLLTFIAWCPLTSMKTDFLLTYSPRRGGGEPDMRNIHELQEFGWIQGTDRRVEMRPFVAECIRRMTQSRNAYAGFRYKIIDEWLPAVRDDKSLYDTICVLTKEPDETELIKAMIVLSYYSEIDNYSQIDDQDVELALIAGAIHSGNASPLSEEKLRIFKLINSVAGISRTKYLISRVILMQNHDPKACTDMTGDKVLKEEMKKRTVPDRLVATYVSYATYILYERSELDKAFELARWLLDNSDDSHMCSRACIYIASYYLSHLQYEEATKYIEDALTDAYGMDEYCSLMLLKISMYQMLHRYQDALRELDELKTYISDSSRSFRIDYEAEVSLSQGVLLRDMGEPDRALKYIYKAVSLKKLYNGQESLDYKTALGDLANAYEKTGHYEESERCYLEAITYFEKQPETMVYTILFKNNLSVLYIKMGEPKKAIAILDSIDMGSPAVSTHIRAEIENNYSRSYDLLGDSENAIKYAEAAYPVLREIFGASDKKCTENRERYQNNLGRNSARKPDRK